MRPLWLRLFDYFYYFINAVLGFVALAVAIALIRSVLEGKPSSIALNASFLGLSAIILGLTLKFALKSKVNNIKQGLGVILALALMLFGAEEASIRASIMVEDFYAYEFSELGLEYLAMTSAVICLWLLVSLIGCYLLHRIEKRITSG
ncbi:hypothetical protein EUZ85_08240 [Hahella sp. KA22]|uniref:hypothetical protein n=1 Tax=Hahella sp. KA22 TaxID=1628392 RepID=UPI000FDD4CB6|nr:hypothetical protein [Hahella sp. KA22]AZZ90702.1 hypothetical protein ENC22_05690 [Hahella sp. KA22]QAY54072.1 hypothetical protein EUZ85_08240 [Hahella sp. KA22]